MNPWIHMYYATTGFHARKVHINKGQEITRQEALELYTRSDGWFVREENDLGQASRWASWETWSSSVTDYFSGVRPGGPEADPLGADHRRRQHRARRESAARRARRRR